MYCKMCGKENKEGSLFCAACGASLKIKTQSEEYGEKLRKVQQIQLNEQPKQAKQTSNYGSSSSSKPDIIMVSQIPEEYRPIGMWGYLGYDLLFAIPLLGQLALIILACGGNSNKNVTNYARSKFCVVIIIVVLILSMGGFGVVAAMLARMF